MKQIILIGAGGHARTLARVVQAMGCFTLTGFVDRELKAGDFVGSVPVLGGDEIIENGEYAEACVSIGVGIVKACDTRKRLFDACNAKGYSFAVLRDPSAIVADDAEVGDGVQIMPNAVVHTGASIGENTIINTAAVVEHDCTVGPHAHVAPGAILGGGASVGECSMIGMGAKVLPGIRVGKYVTVGAGAVVVDEIDDGLTVCGVPARAKGRSDE